MRLYEVEVGTQKHYLKGRAEARQKARAEARPDAPAHVNIVEIDKLKLTTALLNGEKPAIERRLRFETHYANTE